MPEHFEAVRISDHVYWVGAIDWVTRDFHGYSTPRGTTYNAYLIMADRITLVDSVKSPYKDELLTRIASVVDPASIDLVISNHSEMDHSGCLKEVADVIQPERIVASVMGQKALAQHFPALSGVEAVKDGETLDLGNLTVQFLETRMLHWPDSMFTWIPDEKVLLSQDGFGMHYATCERFVDELDWPTIKYESEKYYANIILPYSPVVLKLLDRIAELGIEPDVVGPDHGPVWRGDFPKILELYGRWAKQEPTMKAVIVYDTMWGSTEKMARAVTTGLRAGGACVRVLPLSGTDRSTAATELLEAGALVVGSPTINNQIFPSLADIMSYLKGLKPKNLVGAAFGSYGWSGEATKLLTEHLTSMGVEIVADPERVHYVPETEDLRSCRAFGERIAAEMKKRMGEGE